jgi:hypothetical protein
MAKCLKRNLNYKQNNTNAKYDKKEKTSKKHETRTKARKHKQIMN